MPPTISRATTAHDLRAVAQLFRAYAASLDVDLAYQDFETELKSLPGKYAPPLGALLLARDGLGIPLGCVAIRKLHIDGACEMKRLYVAPEARGTGLGLSLIQAVTAEARNLGYRHLCLDTLPSMTRAQALYRSLGFEPMAPYYDTPIAGTAFLRLDLRR